MKGLIDKIIRQYKEIDNGESKIIGEYERSNVWYINPETKSKHLAPFPLELPMKLISYYSYKNDIVLDMFMGSATIGVACINTDRKFIGIEIDENYFKMSNDRIEESLKNK